MLALTLLLGVARLVAAALDPPAVHTPPGIIVDVAYLNLLAGLIVPILVELLSRSTAPSWVKTFLALVLSAVGSVVSQLLAHDGLLVWRLAVLSFATTFLVSLAAHLGVWKPLGVTGGPGTLAQKATGGAGLTGAPLAPYERRQRVRR